jgi:hypothetical protein
MMRNRRVSTSALKKSTIPFRCPSKWPGQGIIQPPPLFNIILTENMSILKRVKDRA